MLKKYSETYDKKLLIKILSNAYGEHVNEIFKERPDLDLLLIDNFKIFILIIYFHKQKTRKSQPDSNWYQRFSHLNYVTFLKTKQ